MNVYFLTPAVNVSVVARAVTAVMFDPAMAAAAPTVEMSEAGLPAESFAVIVRVAMSPGTYEALSRDAEYE